VPYQLKNLFKEHLVLFVAVIITLAAYFKFLFFGHISWDDPEMVFKNEAIKSFNIKMFFTNHYVGNYLPITMIAHALGWLFFGNSDSGHHFLNILFHLINGILVYNLGKRLFKNESVANIGAVIFLLHPLQIESVGWISELKNVLSTTFYLSALLSYISYNEQKKQKDYLLTFLFFILGCLSKSSVVVLPLSLICIDIISQQRVSIRFLWNKIPLLLISLLLGIINIKTQSADTFINHSHEFPYYQRFGLAGFALVKYTLLFILPINMSVIYPYPEINWPIIVTGYVFLALLIALIILFIRKRNYRALAILFFIVINLVLVLQLLPFGEVLYADRYIYIPVIGFAWALGLALSKIKIPATAPVMAIILFFSVFTFARVNVWKSAIILYEDIIKKHPDLFVALNSAGVESMFLNKDEKALEYFNRAVAAGPRNYKGYYNRGLLYVKNKRPELAVKSFNESLALYPYMKAYTGRATAYHMMGDFSKAMNDANFVIKREPNNAKAHFVLGNCYNDLNKLDEALREYNECIRINKDEPDFYFKRAIVFGKKQDFQSCLNDLLVCLELNPAYYEAYYWKGVAKLNLKQDPCEDLKIAAQHNFEPAINAFNRYCR
jgi:tetratricopeptide (TPR) repeat protein